MNGNWGVVYEEKFYDFMRGFGINFLISFIKGDLKGLYWDIKKFVFEDKIYRFEKL